ncbi:MAG: branched-chain amino acid ABC transporter permease [Albidovulum sp.]|nr:branched-chain amino acid ABC transporter permease [Albidovulum sp.]MDE0307655.1 branched-chain amino acid ABC transporter permease [Albidovulum sp.]MDE0534115.1 branched-chain amino acid ABC transporter permease [Albidovulum sp.]
MSSVVQYLLAGLGIGGIYALVALGFHIMWSSAKAVNFAHGDTLMLGAVLTIVFLDFGLPMSVAIALAIGVSVIFGVVLERVAIRPFAAQARSIGWMLTTIAIGIMLESYATISFGAFARPLPSPLAEKPVIILGAGVFPQELLIPLAAVAIVGLLYFFQRRTQLGRAMRAVAFNREAAGIVGINVTRIAMISFALASALGGLSGILVAPVIQASATMGLLLGIKGFAVAIIGGITSAPGVVIAGLLYGVIEKFVDGYISTAAREAVGFSIVILVLMIWPQGLFGRKEIVKV